MDWEKIGRFLAERRKRRRLTRREFAQALGIGNKTVSKWACGNGMPESSLTLPTAFVIRARKR